MDTNLTESSRVLVIPFSDSNKEPAYLFIKRLFDIFCGFLGTLLVIPMSLIIKILYMLHGDFHPIFFTQVRIGLDGKAIKIFKFRSMVPNAEEVLDDLLEKDPKIRDEYLTNKKLANDPRVTPVGKIIRRCSIDEFPQFINVLIGNMTVVGPRPYLFREKEDMGVYFEDIIKCKPGITGLWQVSGRNEVAFTYRLQLDRVYSIRRTVLFDLKIALETFRTVFGGK